MSSECRVTRIYDRCMFKDCTNTRLSKRLFRFPMQKDARYEIWIRNTGNTKLEKFSPATLRSASLCEDHFTATCFTNATKERLTRNAIPIPYNDTGSSANNENVEIEQRVQTNYTAAFSFNNENVTEVQLPEQSALRTYKRANLNFDVTAEEENIMEWVHREPSMAPTNDQRQDNGTQTNNKDAKIIKDLNMENRHLRQQLRRQKFLLQRMSEKCKILKSKKKTKETLKKTKQTLKKSKETFKKLINEQYSKGLSTKTVVTCSRQNCS